MNQVVLPHRQAAGAIPASAYVLMPTTTEFVAVLIASMMALLGYAYGGTLMDWTNYLVPTIITVSVGWGAVQIVYRDKAGIWTPLFWNRIALAVYFGVGSLVPFIVNPETREYIQGFYTFFNEDVAKYNVIICLFTFIYITVTRLILTLRSSEKGDKVYPESGFDQKTIGLILLFIGLVLHVFLLVPVSFGIYRFEIPTFLTLVAQSIYIGIFLLTSWYIRVKSALLYVLAALSFLLFLYGIIEINKSIALFPLVVLLLGYLYEKFSLGRAAAVFVFLFLTYFAISPLVTFARDRIGFAVEAGYVIPVETRVEALLSYGDEVQQAAGSDIQGGWSRLSYVNGATFAISQYDLGKPGDSLRDIFVVWIPRVLYPDKPEITALGREFNYEATGNDQSQSTPGLVAEGYWSYGWLGVCLFAIAIACISTYWSMYSVAVLRSESWHLFFVVLLGMRTGIRMDGLMVADIVGPIGFAVLGHVALQFLNRLLVERRGQSATAAAA